MTTSPTPGFTPSEAQIRCAQALLVAKAHESLVRPIVEGYQHAILAKHQFKVAERWIENGAADADCVVTDGNRSYLLSDEDFAVYNEACHLARDAEGLSVRKPDNCPLLEAENMRIQCENVLLQAWEGHPRFSGLSGTGVLGIEKRNHAIELTLGLLAPHLKENAHDMLADLGIHPPAPKSQPSDSSPEP